MPFRDQHAPTPTGFDPLHRFAELCNAFEAERGMFGDRAPLRLAAVSLVLTPGPADELAAHVRTVGSHLDAIYGGWTSSIDASLRLVLAAALVRTGEDATAFGTAIARVQAMMDAAKVRKGGAHSLLAAMVLRRVAGGEPGEAHVLRMRAIYERMKHHHWFLTGPEDLPACAMLVGRPGSPEQIGDHVEAIYRRLADVPKIWGGEELQTAANVLGLLAFAPDEAAARFVELAAELRARGVKVRGAEYDEVAVLAFIPRSAALIAERVTNMRDRIVAELAWYESSMGTSLASNLAFVELLHSGDDARVGLLADAKLLLDMQAIVTMRQASAMGGVSVT